MFDRQTGCQPSSGIIGDLADPAALFFRQHDCINGERTAIHPPYAAVPFLSAISTCPAGWFIGASPGFGNTSLLTFSNRMPVDAEHLAIFCHLHELVHRQAQMILHSLFFAPEPFQARAGVLSQYHECHDQQDGNECVCHHETGIFQDFHMGTSKPNNSIGLTGEYHHRIFTLHENSIRVPCRQ